MSLFNVRKRKKMVIALSLFLLFSSAHAQEPSPNPPEPIIPPCQPQGSTLTEQFLSCIQHYTNGILQKTNMLPDYIRSASAYFLSWMNTEEKESSIIPEFQANITNYDNETTKITTKQKDMQQQIVKDFFKDPGDIRGEKAIEPTQLQNANDLEYQILLGIPYFKEDPRKRQFPDVNPPRNYITNASALNIQHVIPSLSWHPREDIQRQRYFNYYNTVSAVQTYNGYILSNLYADYENKFALTEVQKKLLEQVSGKKKENGQPGDESNWLIQVGSDNLGLVLRHILLFDSQIFALMARLLDVEKQMLISQAMTNSLLIALNLGNEDMLVKKANGTLNIP